MPESASFLPAMYDVVWTGIVLLIVGLAVWALIRVGADRSLTPGVRLGWSLFIVFVPVLGAAAWLLAGRPRRPVDSASTPAREE